MIQNHFSKLWMLCVISRHLKDAMKDAVVNSKSHTGPGSDGVFSPPNTWHAAVYHILLWVPDGRWFTQHDAVMCR